jgi:hypothetical protein
MVPLSPVLVVVAVPGSTAGTAFGLGSNVRPNARPIAAGAAAGLVLAMLHAGAAPAASVVDEIHYSYGDTGDSVVVDWRGAERILSFGPTMAYGFVAVANPPAVTPVDSAGPFREIRLHGLAPDTTYHYRIGAGPDHVLQTAPLGSFRWVDVGDTASTLCKPWVAQVHTLISRLAPRFVTHGGDISEANVCGAGAVHRYYDDQQVWSTSAAFQPVWGNHEYGYADDLAPAGTPRDSLANYKGRGFITNGRSVSLDTADRITPPGCLGADLTNGCPGEDWGWFQAGGVLFISYPEVWTGALESWEPVADKLMAAAQRDPTIAFIVTYGHRPAYSSLTDNGWDPTVRAALNKLARRYSPHPSNPRGKYVLNVAHHVHGFEVFTPIRGLTHITDAGGGQGVADVRTAAKRSLLRLAHLGVLAGDYDAASSRLTLRWVCGPAFGDKTTCGYGDTVWSTTFTAYGAPHLPPRPPALVGPAVANGPVRAADPPAAAAPRSTP